MKKRLTTEWVSDRDREIYRYLHKLQTIYTHHGGSNLISWQQVQSVSDGTVQFNPCIPRREQPLVSEYVCYIGVREDCGKWLLSNHRQITKKTTTNNLLAEWSTVQNDLNGLKWSQDRHTDRQADRHADTHTNTQIDSNTVRQTTTQPERQAHERIDTPPHTHTYTDIYIYI